MDIDEVMNRGVLFDAIEKAIKNGWRPWWNDKVVTPDKIVATDEYYDPFDLCYPASIIIFDHEFAKALWPDPIVISKDDSEKLSQGKPIEVKEYPFTRHWYQYHLMQMAAAEDRIKYIKENT